MDRHEKPFRISRERLLHLRELLSSANAIAATEKESPGLLRDIWGSLSTAFEMSSDRYPLGDVNDGYFDYAMCTWGVYANKTRNMVRCSNEEALDPRPYFDEFEVTNDDGEVETVYELDLNDLRLRWGVCIQNATGNTVAQAAGQALGWVIMEAIVQDLLNNPDASDNVEVVD